MLDSAFTLLSAKLSYATLAHLRHRTHKPDIESGPFAKFGKVLSDGGKFKTRAPLCLSSWSTAEPQYS
jgi:hypothetical protein